MSDGKMRDITYVIVEINSKSVKKLENELNDVQLQSV
jgi:hypothetical protein